MGVDYVKMLFVPLIFATLIDDEFPRRFYGRAKARRLNRCQRSGESYAAIELVARPPPPFAYRREVSLKN
jgi:hypothetical protein